MVGIHFGGQANEEPVFRMMILKQQPRGVRKAKCEALYSLLPVGDEGNVVREEKVPHNFLLFLGVG